MRGATRWPGRWLRWRRLSGRPPPPMDKLDRRSPGADNAGQAGTPTGRTGGAGAGAGGATDVSDWAKLGADQGELARLAERQGAGDLPDPEHDLHGHRRGGVRSAG